VCPFSSQASEHLIKSLWQEYPMIIPELHLVHHSLPCAFFLEAMASNDLSPEQQTFFVETSRMLMLSADASQVQVCPTKFAAVCRKFKDVLVQRGLARQAVLPLQSAVAKLQVDPSALTPLHGDLLQACLVSKFYRVGADHLYPGNDADQKNLVVGDPKVSGLTVRDFLLYCYYGGMILVGEKRFEESTDFFLKAFTVPAMALSAIMIASFKKYLLVCLLLHGVVTPIPEYTSQVVQRSIGAYCSEYLEFAKAYSTYETQKLEEILAKHEAIFSKDHNLGLVKQCLPSLRKRVVQRLTQTYLTLSLEDLSTKGQVAEAEALLLRMIESKEIVAKISQKDQMVVFPDEDTSSLETSLQHQINRAIKLGAQVEELDESLMVNRVFLQNTAIRGEQV